MAVQNQSQWYIEPTKEMIVDLRSLKQISDEDKQMVMNQMANANHPKLIQFHENAIKHKDFNTEQHFTLFDNEIRPSWNQSKMTRSYKSGIIIKTCDGKTVREKISNQFSKKYKNYNELATKQDVINKKIKINVRDNGSINNIQEMINQSVENCVKFAESLAKTYQDESNNNKSRDKSKNDSPGNHYIMAERFDQDLTNLNLNKYAQNNGCTGFFYDDLRLLFPGFNNNMNIVGGRFYQSGPHLENLNLDSYNHQTYGLKLWFVYHPSCIEHLEKYIATGVPATMYDNVKYCFLQSVLYFASLCLKMSIQCACTCTYK